MQFERNECGSRTGSYNIFKRVLYDLRHDMHTSRASVLADSKFCTIPRDWGVVWFGNHGSFCPPGLMRVVLQAVHQPGRASTSPPYMHLSLSLASVYCKRQICMYPRHIKCLGKHSWVCVSFPLPIPVVPFTLGLGKSSSSQHFEQVQRSDAPSKIYLASLH